MANLASPWYPVNGGNYVYLNSLASSTNPDAASALSAGRAQLAAAHASLGSNVQIQKAIQILQGAYNKEIQQEMNFFQSLGLNLDSAYGNLVNGRGNWKEIIDTLNAIFQDGALYEEALAAISNLEKTEKGLYKRVGSGDEAIYSLINYELPQFLTKELTNSYSVAFTEGKTTDEIAAIVAQDIQPKFKAKFLELVGYELNEFGRIVQLNKETYQPYQLLISIIEREERMGDSTFFNKLFESFGITVGRLKNSINNKLKNSKAVAKIENMSEKKLKALTSINFASKYNTGISFELFVQQYLEGKMSELNFQNSDFKFEAIHTGNLNESKGDHQIFQSMDINFDVSKVLDAFDEVVKAIKEEGETSTRIQNIEGIRRLKEMAAEAKSRVIFISDKNYKLNAKSSGFSSGGFGAQTSPLGAIEKVLRRTDMPVGTILSIIFILANSGSYAINGNDYSDVTEQISSVIGAFLFDDVALQAENDVAGADAVHLFNLNNVYVPLSVMLGGVLNAIGDGSMIKEFVTVSVEAQNIENVNPSGSPLTQDDWNLQYKEALARNKLSIHFFHDFVDFIQGGFKI